MAEKTGAGGKPQEYDENSGRYGGSGGDIRKAVDNYKPNDLKAEVDRLNLSSQRANNLSEKRKAKFLTEEENKTLEEYKIPKEPIQRKPEHAVKWAKYDNDYEGYKSREPQITADIDEISRQTGMSLIGREFRLKGKDSYDRKVNDKRIEGEYKPLGDVVRYTFEHSMNNAPKQIKDNLAALKNKGYKIVAIDNKWKQPGAYNGINVI